MNPNTTEVPGEPTPDFGPTDLPAGINPAAGETITSTEEAKLEEFLGEILSGTDDDDGPGEAGVEERDI